MTTSSRKVPESSKMPITTCGPGGGELGVSNSLGAKTYESEINEGKTVIGENKANRGLVFVNIQDILLISKAKRCGTRMPSFISSIPRKLFALRILTHYKILAYAMKTISYIHTSQASRGLDPKLLTCIPYPGSKDFVQLQLQQ